MEAEMRRDLKLLRATSWGVVVLVLMLLSTRHSTATQYDDLPRRSNQHRRDFLVGLDNSNDFQRLEDPNDHVGQSWSRQGYIINGITNWTQVEQEKKRASTLVLKGNSFSYTFTQEEPPLNIQRALTHAASIWSGVVKFPFQVQVNLNWTDLGSDSVLAHTRSFVFKPDPNISDISGLPVAIPALLYHVRTGIKPDDFTFPDMEITVNSAMNWFTEETGNVPGDRPDLVSAMIHEIAHGLFFTTMFLDDGSLIELKDHTGQTYFLWYDLLLTSEGRERVSSHYPSQNTEKIIDALSGSKLVVLDYPNGNPILNIEQTFLRTNLIHFNEAIYRAGNPNSLLTPRIRRGESVRHPGYFVLELLRFVGYPVINYDCSQYHNSPSQCLSEHCDYCHEDGRCGPGCASSSPQGPSPYLFLGLIGVLYHLG